MKNLILLVLFGIGFLSSCGKNSETDQVHDDHGDGHSEEHEEASSTTFTLEQIRSVGIELGSIERKQLTSSLKANGFLKVPNQSRANATSMMGGIVTSINIQPGSNVRRGQVLANITNTSFVSMQEEFLSASSKLELAELELSRLKELLEGNATATKNLQQAEAEIRTLLARRSGLQKQLDMIGIDTDELDPENIRSSVSVRSPISGTVAKVDVNIGSFVEPGSLLAEIVDNSRLHLDLFVYEKDLDELMVGQTIHFTLTNNPGKEYDAKIFSISNTFEQNTKVVAVHAAVEGNKEGLIDGMNITAIVSLDNNVLDAVPTEAIVNYQGIDYIFMESKGSEVSDSVKGNDSSRHENISGKEDHADEHDHEHDHGHGNEEELTGNDKTHVAGETITFVKIPVKKGTTDVGYTEIALLEEIPADAKIAVKGAFFILAKMTNRGEGHSH